MPATPKASPADPSGSVPFMASSAPSSSAMEPSLRRIQQCGSSLKEETVITETEAASCSPGGEEVEGGAEGEKSHSTEFDMSEGEIEELENGGNGIVDGSAQQPTTASPQQL